MGGNLVTYRGTNPRVSNSIFFLGLDGPPDVKFGLGITFGFLSIAANRFYTFNALVCVPELQVQAYTEYYEFTFKSVPPPGCRLVSRAAGW